VDIAIAVVFTVAAVLAVLASRRDLRTMRDYRERSRRELGDSWAQVPVGDRTSAKRQIRRGKAVSDPQVADILIREYDAIGTPPDFTRRSGLVGLAGTTTICVLAAIGGLRVVGIVAGFFLLAFLGMTVWKWRLRRSIATSVAETRRMHEER
jgi:hypothetical protein